MKRILLAGCALLLAGAGAPPNTRDTEALGWSLAGPCAAFGYRAPAEARGVLVAASSGGVADVPFPRDLRRETTTMACAAPGLNLDAGVLFGQMIAANVADPYLAGGYRVTLGYWRLGVAMGLICQRYSNKPHRDNGTLRLGPFSPFFIFTARMRF